MLLFVVRWVHLRGERTLPSACDQNKAKRADQCKGIVAAVLSFSQKQHEDLANMSAPVARQAVARAALTTRAVAMAIPAALATVRSLHSASSPTFHHGTAVDWDKIKREQQRRARLAQHAIASPLGNNVDWERIKMEQARRHRLAAHATSNVFTKNA